jgi:hypothetical protein
MRRRRIIERDIRALFKSVDGEQVRKLKEQDPVVIY